MLSTRCLNDCDFSLFIFQEKNADALKVYPLKLAFHFYLELKPATIF